MQQFFLCFTGSWFVTTWQCIMIIMLIMTRVVCTLYSDKPWSEDSTWRIRLSKMDRARLTSGHNYGIKSESCASLAHQNNTLCIIIIIVNATQTMHADHLRLVKAPSQLQRNHCHCEMTALHTFSLWNYIMYVERISITLLPWLLSGCVR